MASNIDKSKGENDWVNYSSQRRGKKKSDRLNEQPTSIGIFKPADKKSNSKKSDITSRKLSIVHSSQQNLYSIQIENFYRRFDTANTKESDEYLQKLLLEVDSLMIHDDLTDGQICNLFILKFKIYSCKKSNSFVDMQQKIDLCYQLLTKYADLQSMPVRYFPYLGKMLVICKQMEKAKEVLLFSYYLYKPKDKNITPLALPYEKAKNIVESLGKIFISQGTEEELNEVIRILELFIEENANVDEIKNRENIVLFIDLSQLYLRKKTSEYSEKALQNLYTLQRIHKTPLGQDTISFNIANAYLEFLDFDKIINAIKILLSLQKKLSSKKKLSNDELKMKNNITKSIFYSCIKLKNLINQLDHHQISIMVDFLYEEYSKCEFINDYSYIDLSMILVKYLIQRGLVDDLSRAEKIAFYNYTKYLSNPNILQQYSCRVLCCLCEVREKNNDHQEIEEALKLIQKFLNHNAILLENVYFEIELRAFRLFFNAQLKNSVNIEDEVIILEKFKEKIKDKCSINNFIKLNNLIVDTLVYDIKPTLGCLNVEQQTRFDRALKILKTLRGMVNDGNEECPCDEWLVESKFIDFYLKHPNSLYYKKFVEESVFHLRKVFNPKQSSDFASTNVKLEIKYCDFLCGNLGDQDSIALAIKNLEYLHKIFGKSNSLLCGFHKIDTSFCCALTLHHNFDSLQKADKMLAKINSSYFLKHNHKFSKKILLQLQETRQIMGSVQIMKDSHVLSRSNDLNDLDEFENEGLILYGNLLLDLDVFEISLHERKLNQLVKKIKAIYKNTAIFNELMVKCYLVLFIKTNICESLINSHKIVNEITLFNAIYYGNLNIVDSATTKLYLRCCLLLYYLLPKNIQQHELDRVGQEKINELFVKYFKVSFEHYQCEFDNFRMIFGHKESLLPWQEGFLLIVERLTS